MSRLRVIPIVEGHGEVAAVRTLLERTWREVLQADWIDVLRPIRRPRSKLLRPGVPGGCDEPNTEEIERVVKLAAKKLHEKPGSEVPELILLLIDAEDQCPRELAPRILEAAGAAADRCRAAVAVVLANKEYETWFVAAGRSLADYVDLPETLPAWPETQRCGKTWISERFRGPRYSETVDQVKLTAKMNLHECRSRWPSFDKLCRVLQESGTRPAPMAERADS